MPLPKPKRPSLPIDVEALTDTLIEKGLRLHSKVFQASNGRIGRRPFGTTCLLLHTTGRHSGLERTTTLAYATDGDQLVLVASNGGSDHGPDWLANLRAEPGAAVQIGGERRPVTTRVVERFSEGYERLLRIANANNSFRYFHYQQKTARPIPVVVLTLEDD